MRKTPKLFAGFFVCLVVTCVSTKNEVGHLKFKRDLNNEVEHLKFKRDLNNGVEHLKFKRDLNEALFSNEQKNSSGHVLPADDNLGLPMAIDDINDIDISQDPCLHVGSCEYNRGLQKPGCYCDEFCPYLNDCCIDYIKADMVTPFSNNKWKKLNCHAVENSDYHGYAMVTECSIQGEKIEELRRKCESSDDTIPINVPVTDIRNITYKNRYCALCNGVSTFQAWNLEIHTSMMCNKVRLLNLIVDALLKKTSLLNRLIKQLSCKLVSVPPNYVAVRTCWNTSGNLATDSNLATDNNSTLQTRLCSSYQNPLKTDQKVYKNYFCALSDKVTAENYVCHNDTRSERRVIDRRTIEIKVPSLSGYGHQTCSSVGLFNPTSPDCRLVTCEDSTESGNCEETPVFKNFYIREIFQLCVNVSVPETHFRLVLALYSMLLPVHDYTTKVAFKAVHTTFADDSKILTTDSSCDFVNMTITALSIEGRKITDFLALQEKFKAMRFSYSALYGVNYIRFTKSNVTKSQISSEMASPNMSSFQLENSDVILLQKQINMGIFTGKRLMTVPQNLEIESMVAFHEKMNIDYILITSWRTYFKYDFKKPLILDSTKTKTLILRITTYITMGISSLALIATIMAYVYVGMIDRTAARISMHMMGTMLTAHVLFLFGIGATDVSVICLIVGILIHYIWLSCFAWISCFVMHASIDFEKMRKYPAQIHSPNRKISAIIYSIGYGIPLFIVVPSLILEFYPYADFDISHTGNACFIKGYPWSIVFFSGPVLFSLVANLVSSISSIRSITKFVFIQNTEETPSLRYLKAYVKLCILSGVSWCLGIIADVTSNDVIQFLFVFLSGFHGLCVCLCFVCSSSFIKQLRIAKETRRRNGNHSIELS